MADPSPIPNPKERVAGAVYFASLYFLSVGTLYLWGYWSLFGINILEHLPLTDVLKTTAYPVATALLLCAVGAALGETLVSNSNLPPGGGRETKLGIFLRRFAAPLLILYVLGTIGLLVFGPIEKWRLLPVLLSVPLYVAAKQAGLLIRLIPHESPRSIVLYVLASLPALSYGHGLLAANKIQTGAAFAYLLSEVPKIPGDSDPQKALRYIGTAGDLVFLFDPTRVAVVRTKLEAGTPLVLKQYDRLTAPTKESVAPAAPISESAGPASSPSSAASSPAGPNPSLKPSPNGKPPGPVRGALHSPQPGPGVFPLVPA